jgi:hypothetical protein
MCLFSVICNGAIDRPIVGVVTCSRGAGACPMADFRFNPFEFFKGSQMSRLCKLTK